MHERGFVPRAGQFGGPAIGAELLQGALSCTLMNRFRSFWCGSHQKHFSEGSGSGNLDFGVGPVDIWAFSVDL